MSFKIDIPKDLPPEYREMLTNDRVDVNQSGAIDHGVELAPALKGIKRIFGECFFEGKKPPDSLKMFRRQIGIQIKKNLAAAYGRLSSLLRCGDKTYESFIEESLAYIKDNEVAVVGIGEIHDAHPDSIYVSFLKRLHDEFGIGTVLEEGVPWDMSEGIATDDRGSPHYRFLQDKDIKTTALPIGRDLLDADTLSAPFLKEIEEREGREVVVGYLGNSHLLDEEGRRRHIMTVATFNKGGYGIARDNTSVIYGENIPIFDFPNLLDEMRGRDIPILGVAYSFLGAEGFELMNQQDAIFTKASLPLEQFLEILDLALEGQRRAYDSISKLPIVDGYHVGVEREKEDLFSIRYLAVDELGRYYSPSFLEALHYVMNLDETKRLYGKGGVRMRKLASRIFNDVGEVQIDVGDKTFRIEVDRKTGRARIFKRFEEIPF